MRHVTLRPWEEVYTSSDLGAPEDPLLSVQIDWSKVLVFRGGGSPDSTAEGGTEAVWRNLREPLQLQTLQHFHPCDPRSREAILPPPPSLATTGDSAATVPAPLVVGLSTTHTVPTTVSAAVKPQGSGAPGPAQVARDHGDRADGMLRPPTQAVVDHAKELLANAAGQCGGEGQRCLLYSLGSGHGDNKDAVALALQAVQDSAEDLVVIAHCLLPLLNRAANVCGQVWRDHLNVDAVRSAGLEAVARTLGMLPRAVAVQQIVSMLRE